MRKMKKFVGELWKNFVKMFSQKIVSAEKYILIQMHYTASRVYLNDFPLF